MRFYLSFTGKSRYPIIKNDFNIMIMIKGHFKKQENEGEREENYFVFGRYNL